MSNRLKVPPATASSLEHADWLELNAICTVDQNSSIHDLIREIRRSGSTDAMGDLDEGEYCSDVGAEQSAQVAEDAFSEIERRLNACGGDKGAFPFVVGDGYIEVAPNWDCSTYTVLLLLSSFGHDAGPKNRKGAKLFEEISAEAAKSYFGGPHAHVDALVFGSPREKNLPSSFDKAVNHLCRELGEGERFRANLTAEYSHKKDDGLDIVVWRDFEDRRQGKMIGFGQCATGKKRDKKTGELNVKEFCSMWMSAQPVVEPRKMFFVPNRVEDSKWCEMCLRGGILFDRCRIAYYAKVATGKLKEDCGVWVKYVLANEVAN